MEFYPSMFKWKNDRQEKCVMNGKHEFVPMLWGKKEHSIVYSPSIDTFESIGLHEVINWAHQFPGTLPAKKCSSFCHGMNDIR
jgi:hypothetical protein